MDPVEHLGAWRMLEFDEVGADAIAARVEPHRKQLADQDRGDPVVGAEGVDEPVRVVADATQEPRPGANHTHLEGLRGSPGETRIWVS